jgi:hypothetical protein
MTLIVVIMLWYSTLNKVRTVLLSNTSPIFAQ